MNVQVAENIERYFRIKTYENIWKYKFIIILISYGIIQIPHIVQYYKI